ncbi:MAG: lipase family protein [Bacteroidia bacterium]|nr:lipase family protein [Bacteroidia bacterium]
MRIILFSILALLSGVSISAQLVSGFQKEEYLECLRIASHFKNGMIEDKYKCETPKEYERIYESPTMGFDNKWELWENKEKKIFLVSLRGSVPTQVSWFANFHAGLLPAQGKYHLVEDYDYKLCEDGKALVHAGWLGSVLSLSKDIEAKIDSCYKAGMRDCILTGHSQGGAICALLTAYLLQKQKDGLIAADIRFKTYCSAAPKPGDYRFAMQYDRMTRGGWAFNVVNADDWVPETPLSVQTPDDFNETSPFRRVDDMVKAADMKGMDKLKIKMLIRLLKTPTRKSEKRLTKYLGYTMADMLSDLGVDYGKPALVHCANFQRAGVTIVLMPDEQYHQAHKYYADDIFEHHMFVAYMDLAVRDL